MNSNPEKTQFRLLTFTAFFVQMMQAMVNLALVYYIRAKFNVSASLVGAAVSALSISYCVFCLLLSNKITNYKPSSLLIFGTLGMALSTLLMFTLNKYFLVVIAIIMFGFFVSFIWPSLESWLSRGKEQAYLNKVLGGYNVSWSLGNALSATVCGVLVERNILLPFYFAIAILIIVAFNIVFWIHKDPELKAAKSEKDHIKANNLKDTSTFLRYFCWTGVFVGYIVFGAIINIFPLYAKESIGYSATTIGLLLLVRGLVTCVVFYVLSKTSFWHFRKLYIFGVQLLIGLSCLFARNSTSILSLSIFFGLFGVLFAYVYVSSLFHGASGAVNRTKRMVTHEFLLSAGTVVGSVVGGVLYDHFSYSQMMVIFFLFITASVIIEFIISSVTLPVSNKSLTREFD